MAVGLIAIPGTAVTQPLEGDAATTELIRVRSRHPALHPLIVRAEKESATFSRMVHTINASDGIVFVDPGTCGHGLRACLVKVASSGQNRFLFVKVDTGKADHEVMASIGHELQHAVEVLSNPAVRDQSSMYFFYRFNRDRGSFSSPAFETTAAIEAGQAVADEVRRFQRASDQGVRGAVTPQSIALAQAKK
jgi:hypothetical protein